MTRANRASSILSLLYQCACQRFLQCWDGRKGYFPHLLNTVENETVNHTSWVCKHVWRRQNRVHAVVQYSAWWNIWFTVWAAQIWNQRCFVAQNIIGVWMSFESILFNLLPKPLFEIALNVPQGNLPLNKTLYQKLKKNKAGIRLIADKKVCVSKKDRFINQSGGFFLPLLSIVVPFISSLIASWQ